MANQPVGLCRDSCLSGIPNGTGQGGFLFGLLKTLLVVTSCGIWDTHSTHWSPVVGRKLICSSRAPVPEHLHMRGGAAMLQIPRPLSFFLFLYYSLDYILSN